MTNWQITRLAVCTFRVARVASEVMVRVLCESLREALVVAVIKGTAVEMTRSFARSAKGSAPDPCGRNR
jgi:hypothetical protein